MRGGRIALMMAGLLSLMSVGHANECKGKPLAQLPPAPAQGVFHIGRPVEITASVGGEVVITSNGYEPATFGSGRGPWDGRMIVWDGATMTPRHFFTTETQASSQPGTVLRTTIGAHAAEFSAASVSADGRYLAFSLGEPGARCVDVYDNDRHLIRYQDRSLITFYGDQLLLGRVGKESKDGIQGIYLQPVGAKRVGKSLDMVLNGKKRKKASTSSGLHEIDGRGEFGLVQFQSFGSSHYGAVQLGDWQPQPRRSRFGGGDIGRIRPPAPGSEHYQIDVIIDRIHHRTVRVPLALYLSPALIPDPKMISARRVSDDAVAAFWQTDGKRDGSGRDQMYMQMFFAETGLPVHPVPVPVPLTGTYSSISQHGPIGMMLDDEHLLLIPHPAFYMSAERFNVFTAAFEQVALMQPPADARRVAEAHAEQLRQREAMLAAQQAREAALNNVPVIRKVHEQGRAVDAYEAEVYCRLGGPRCADVRRQVRMEQDARNKKAFSDQMRRAWELHSDGADIFLEGRRRAECLRRRDNPTAIANPEFAGQSVGACPR